MVSLPGVGRGLDDAGERALVRDDLRRSVARDNPGPGRRVSDTGELRRVRS
jgi:hypothetical protein